MNRTALKILAGLTENGMTPAAEAEIAKELKDWEADPGEAFTFIPTRVLRELAKHLEEIESHAKDVEKAPLTCARHFVTVAKAALLSIRPHLS